MLSLNMACILVGIQENYPIMKNVGKSRINLNNNEIGNREITLKDIIEDAKSIRLNDHVYDMYIDEFEDLNEEEVHLEFS